MSTSPTEDWRAEAMRQMEMAEPPPDPQPTSSSALIGIWCAKFALLIVLAMGLWYFLGFGWLFALLLVAWYMFWPR